MSQLADESAATLPSSRTHQLLRLQEVDDSTGAVLTVGRSYDGHAWEGVMPQPASFRCLSSGCLAPVPPAGKSHRIVTYDGSAPTTAQTAVRLLTQATFGPTKASVASFERLGRTLPLVAAKGWVTAQMALTPTLHRAYVRTRVNPRAPVSNSVGSARPVCAVGSRWHRYAFTRADRGKTIVATTLNGGSYSLEIDGVVRTEVASSAFDAAAVPAPLTICSVDERIGGELLLGASCADGALTNPAISFASAPAADRLVDFSAGEAAFTPAAPEAVKGTLKAWMTRVMMPIRR